MNRIEDITVALVRLNIARKNARIYPLDHEQVIESLEHASSSLCEMLAHHPRVTVNVGKDRLLFNGTPLTDQGTMLGELTKALKQIEIAAVTFSKGLDQNALLDFLNFLSRENIHADDLSPNETGLSFPGIHIHFLDFSRLSYTDEAVVKPGVEKKNTENFWDVFTTHLVAGTIEKTASDLPVSENTLPEPRQLAEWLNTDQIDRGLALESFGHMLRHCQTDSTASPPASELSEDEAETGASMHEPTELSMLLEELNPEIREQFLDTTFSTLSEAPETDAAESILSRISYRFVVEMLRQANRNNAEISPSLLAMIRKMAHLRGDIPGSNPDFALTASQEDTDWLGRLLQREAVETFVPGEYSTQLNTLSSREATPSPRPENTSITAYLQSIEDAQVDAQIARLLLTFINDIVDVEDYRAYADRLVHMAITNLIETDPALAATIFNTLQQHASYKRIPEIRDIADACTQEFMTPAIASRAVAAFFQQGMETDTAETTFIVDLGTNIVPEAVDRYARQPRAGEHPILKVLARFPEETATEIQQRLRDERSGYVINLITLIRKLELRSAADSMRQLWHDEGHDINLAILETLFKLDDKWGLLLFKKSLTSETPEITDGAVQLAARYRVRDTADDIAGMLKMNPLFNADYEQNEKLLRALSEIGNPSVLPRLAKLAAVKYRFKTKQLKKMKQTLYHSLSGYPHKDVSRLMKTGRRSTDIKIHKAAKHMETKRQDEPSRN